MIRNMLICCAVLAGYTSTAQQAVGHISGNITSGSKAAEFVSIGMKGSSSGTTTDSLGNFQLRNIKPGIHQLQFSGLGYLASSTIVTVVSGKTASVSVELKEDISSLDEVVVTGTMKEVTKMESPIPIEVYTPALFKKNPTPNIFEALAIVNGVQPQINCNVCNTGDIHINGLEGPYTMILIDGMPIVSSLSTVYGLSGIPNSMVKRIEVVKGPASTLYGSEAVGGVINIITRDFATSPVLQADVFGTTVGEYNVDVSSRVSLKNVNTLLGINYFNYTQPTDINGDNFTDVTLQNRISLFNKWSFVRPSGKNATLAGRYVHENRWGGEMQWTPEYEGSSVFYGESITTNRFEFIGNYQLAGEENIDFDYSYNFHHQDSYYGTAPFFARQHVGFAQLRWNHVFGKHDLLTGAPFRYIYYDDNTPGTEDANDLNKPGVTILPGLFAQDEIKFNEKFTTLLGARYDHHNVHGNIFTERISFKFSPAVNSVIRLTGGSGFRVVNLFTEDHAALTGARDVVIKNDLRPEQSWNVNLNYTQVIPHRNGYINLDGSLFFTYFTNKILGDFLTDPDKIIYDNLNGHAISKGITLNSEFYLANGFKFSPGITLMDVYRIDKNVSAEKIPQIHAPGFSGTFTMSYAVKPIQLSFDLTGRVTGPMYLPVVPNDFRPDMSPWFGILNIQATKNLGRRWEIYGGVKNLLNFIPQDPLLRPFDPFDKQVEVDNPYHYTFDTSYTYAPMQGIKGFLGVRMTIK